MGADRVRLNRTRRCARVLRRAVPVAALLAHTALASEGELEDQPPPSSAAEIVTQIERMVPEEPTTAPARRAWLPQPLQTLPPFFADTQLDARFRTYYLRKDRSDDELSEAWAMGGSIHYRSGWLAELFQAEIEGFTSQPIVAPDSRDGTGLLEPVQDGLNVLGIANGKLRYRGFTLTGYRQYLDLPYLNRNDSRMIPNTFEAITLEKSGGPLRFQTGYVWNVKLRNSDEFVSFAEALGLDRDRGIAYGGAIWDPSEDTHVGIYLGGMPDVATRVYAELGAGCDLGDGWRGRLDGQFTFIGDVGEDLLGDALDDTWNFAIRAATSHGGAVFRLGASFAGPNPPNEGNFGASASYVDLMQRTFNQAHEKALLASVSYDFAGLDLDGLTAVVNFAAGFDAELDGGRHESREVDLTLDYRLQGGWWKSFWLRVRGSWLHQAAAARDGTDVRVILRYDFPVI